MLLIDGVKYEEWVPTSEAVFEKLVKDHAKEIFGEQSIYLDIKPYLKSVAGLGSVPDGLTIIYGKNPQWYIVEAELSNHSVYEHIVPQVARFTSGIKNPSTQRKVVDIIYSEILKDEFLNLSLKKAVAPTEIHKFLSDLISNQPILAIIIDKETPELEDVRTALAHLQIRVVEFQTFTREDIGLPVHAHLFEPLYKPHPPTLPTEPQSITQKVSLQRMELKVWRSYTEYGYIGIWKKFRDLFPAVDETIELLNGDGEIFQVKVGDYEGSKQLWYLQEWYRKHPELKEGDIIRISVIEPMKRYRLEIVK